MFLIDVHLKNSSGLDLAIKIRNIPKYEFRNIIFLTTHMEYITQAFKQTHCYDYILKPYNKDEVSVIIDKLILNDRKKDTKFKDRQIIITLKNNIYIEIKLHDIIFIEVKGKNCCVHTVNGKYLCNNISLKKFSTIVSCEDIIQSHRAFLINKNYIKKIEKLDVKLSEIYFNNCKETALLGYKFKNNIMSEFKKGKVMIC